MFFPEKGGFEYGKQAFPEKSVWWSSAMVKNWMYAKMELVRKTVSQYVPYRMLNNG